MPSVQKGHKYTSKSMQNTALCVLSTYFKSVVDYTPFKLLEIVQLSHFDLFVDWRETRDNALVYCSRCLCLYCGSNRV